MKSGAVVIQHPDRRFGVVRSAPDSQRQLPRNLSLLHSLFTRHITAHAATMYSLSAVVATLGFLSFSNAQGTLPQNLIGTWSTKSNQTITGPGFYDPINERLIEPLRTGISYSFTGDGFYEEAYYRAIANPQNPECPSGIMQWQHGSWVMNPNNSLTLTPIAVDGRQLLSVPCDGKSSIYTRYNQTELFQVCA